MPQDIRITLDIRDQAARRKLEKAVRGARGIALQPPGDPCDVLVHEVDPGANQDFPHLARTLSARTRGEIFLTCAEPSPEFLIQAMRAGIHEFLPLPVPPRELGKALARFRERTRSSEPPREGEGGSVTVVAGVKPGAGSTTLAVNLASALQARGRRTALLDLRLPLGEVPLFLDLDYAYTWGEAAENLDRLDATYLDSLLARHGSGLHVLASPGDALAHGTDTPETVARIIAELRRGFDHVVVDTQPGLEDYALREVQAADRILLVMNPSLPCLAHARRVMDTLRAAPGQDAKVRVVSSRHLRDGDIGGQEIEEILQLRVFATLPDDHAAVLSAMNQGRPLAQAAPKSGVTRAVDRLARGMAGREQGASGSPARSLFGLLRRKGGAPLNDGMDAGLDAGAEVSS